MALKRGRIATAEVGPRPLHVLGATARKWLANLFNPYRPYKYYMRGPGPKSRWMMAAAKGGEAKKDDFLVS